MTARSTAAAPAREAAGTTSVVLACRDLTIGYGDLAVARGLHLQVNDGEVLALIGPNGAGKTTLLATIAGEQPQLAGEVDFAGEPLSGPLHHRVRRGLGYVAAERAVVPNLSVRDNLRLGPGPVEAAIEHFRELLPLLNRRAGLCSGGEQQMIALGRALAAAPRLLLVDELSLGLSPVVARRVADAIHRAAGDGLTVVVVEQNLQRALALSNRFLLMRNGEIILEDDSAAYRDRLDALEHRLLLG